MGLVAVARDRSVPPGVNQNGAERIRVPAGGSLTDKAFTMAILLRFASARDSQWNGMISQLTSAGAITGYACERTNGNKVQVSRDNAGFVDSTTTTTSADSWCLHVLTKGDGLLTPRYHRFKYLTGTWVHENFSNTVANPTTPVTTTGLIELGGDFGGASDWFQGDIAAGAIWKQELLDGEVVKLAYNLAYWFESRPSGMWVPRGNELLRDLTGRGADERSRTGGRPASFSVTSLPLTGLDDRQGRDVLWLNSVGTGGQTVSPSGLTSAASFGTPTVVPGGVTKSPSSLTSAAAFGTPTVVPGGVTRSPSSLGSAASFGTPTVTIGGITIVAVGLGSAAAFGTPSVSAKITVVVTGLGSAQAFGTPTIATGNTTIVATGLGSAQAFGSASVSGGTGPTFSPAIHGGKTQR